MLLAALAKAGSETEEESDAGRTAEYRRSPMKVSHSSRMISIVTKLGKRRGGDLQRVEKGERRITLNCPGSHTSAEPPQPLPS